MRVSIGFSFGVVCFDKLKFLFSQTGAVFFELEQLREGVVNDIKKTVLNDQVDVCGAADERVDVVAFDVEVDIQPVQSGIVVLAMLQSQYILHHLILNFWLFVFGGVRGYTCGVPRDVTVFEWAEEDDFAEVLESARAAEFVEEGFAWVFGFLHGELVEAFDGLPLADDPQSSFDLVVDAVEVAEVWGAEWAVEAELVFELGEVLETGPGDDAAHAVTNKVENDSIFIHEPAYVVLDLIGKFLTHSFNIRLGVVLVFSRE
jgi:hypothetical protein